MPAAALRGSRGRTWLEASPHGRGRVESWMTSHDTKFKWMQIFRKSIAGAENDARNRSKPALRWTHGKCSLTTLGGPLG